MNLSGLSAIAPGYQQGQLNMADLQQKAQQIQQAQMAIDQQKRELAGQAALFQGLSQQGGQQGGMPQPPPAPPQQGPQPPMPGQPSQPMQRPPLQMPPGGGQLPMGPQGRPMGPPTLQAAPQVPPAGVQQPPAGGQPQQQPQQDPSQGGDLSPQGQLQIITQIAQSIKQRSPGIDPQTLFEAVKQQIALMGALSQTQKQQLVLATDNLRGQYQVQTKAMGDQTSSDNTDKRVGAQERGQDIGAQNVDKRVAAQIATTNARIADADARLDKTQAAINARQDKSITGRAAAKAATDRLGLLRTQLSQAKQQLSQAVAGGDQTKIAAAQTAVDGAYGRITDFQTKVGAGAAPAAGAPAAGSGPQKVTTQAQFDALPKGATYIGEDGQTYRKP